MNDPIVKEFRRGSITVHHVQTIEASKIEGILGLLGQPFDQQKLNARLIQLQDAEGRLDFENYKKVMQEFVTVKEAAKKMEGDEFIFKHLINRNDFSTP